MVSAISLLAFTGVIRGVKRFAGPLWAAKIREPGILYSEAHLFDIPRVRVAAVYLIAL